MRTRWPDEYGSRTELAGLDAARSFLLEFAGHCNGRNYYLDRWKLMHSTGPFGPAARVFITTPSSSECQVPQCDKGQHTRCAAEFSREEIRNVQGSSEFSFMLRGEDVYAAPSLAR